MTKTRKLNLIEELTTYKNDYQKNPLHPARFTPGVRQEQEVLSEPPPPSVQVDHQSHITYSPSVYVPFDLYFAPKPIVGTHPSGSFTLQESSRRQRAHERVHLSSILPPSLPLDEIKCEDDLETILRYTYTGMHKILMKDAAIKISKRLCPPNKVVVEGNDMRFKDELYPPLPPGWIAAAKHWDCLQSRNLGDPFKTFWARKGPEVECGCCCNPLPEMVSQETKDEIEKLACENKLRLPYDVTKTGYGGYRHICAKGVPLGKS